MKSIGARLSLWYALAATATLACLFVVGYYSLQGYLIHGLDLLNESEFEQIKAHLGPDYKNLSREVIEQRIRETTDYASVLFYIDIDKPPGDVLFYSSNLHGQAIPDIKGKRRYDAEFGSAGLLRVAEFILPPFDVTIATPETQVDGVMEGYAEVASGLLALMLAVSIAIGVGLSRMALRPVRLIRQTATRIGSHNLSERIPVPAVNDEISDLALLLNEMFDRLEASFKHVRRFASDASHELKTPLSLMRLHAEKLLASGALSAKEEEEVITVLEEIARLNSTIDELLFLSRAEARSIKLDVAPHDPMALLTSFSADAQVLAEHHGLRFLWHHDGDGAGHALYEPRWLRRVLLNLLSNAVSVSPAGGCIQLRSRIADGIWRVSLEDEGPGVPEAEREHIFDRFVRLRSPDGSSTYEGSGLGLAICRGIINLHHGRIYAEAAGAHGLRIVFEIPAEPPPRQVVSPSAPVSVASA
jgi:signal transduction histidine kinase